MVRNARSMTWTPTGTLSPPNGSRNPPVTRHLAALEPSPATVRIAPSLCRASDLLIGENVGHNFKHIETDFTPLQQRVMMKILDAKKKRGDVERVREKLQVSHATASAPCSLLANPNPVRRTWGVSRRMSPRKGIGKSSWPCAPFARS